PPLSTAPPPTQPHTLSLHDALPIFGPLTPERPERPEPQGGAPRKRGSRWAAVGLLVVLVVAAVFVVPRIGDRDGEPEPAAWDPQDRKSTRLNSSHEWISYAVFCLKK